MRRTNEGKENKVAEEEISKNTAGLSTYSPSINLCAAEHFVLQNSGVLPATGLLLDSCSTLNVSSNPALLVSST